MRFLFAVMAVTVVLSMGAAAQKTKPTRLPPSSADSKGEPKSTVPPVKSPAATASSKDLQKVENENGKGGHGTQAKKTHTPAVRAAKTSGNNPAINFNGKGGSGNAGTNNRNPGSLKGRLKQKGQGQNHQQ
jgi:hypothetical protein